MSSRNLDAEDLKIMKKLKLKRWSTSVPNYKNFCKRNDLLLKDTVLKVSSDSAYLIRKSNRHKVGIRLRSLSGISSTYRYDEYLMCKGVCLSCKNQIKCALRTKK